MNSSFVGIIDLPHELIMKIWNNLNNIDVLYSFVGVNQRFNRLIRDKIYTRSLRLAEKSVQTNKYSSLPDSIIDRFCLFILPEINEYIECLILEPFSMKRILLSCAYPHLYKIVFTQIGEDFIIHHFTDKSPLIKIFKNNIKHLILTMNSKQCPSSLTSIDSDENILSRNFHTFPNLIELDFNENDIEYRPVISICGLPSTICFSFTLINLSISMKTFDDCLCLLDGRFLQLQKLCVVIHQINTPSLSIENLTTVLNLKSFSVFSYSDTNAYDSSILPLIRQMLCLEELLLSLNVIRPSTFIDGNHLKDEILIYLPQLQIFKLNITTRCEYLSNEIYLQSNNDISCTFSNWQYGQVNCYISHYPNNVAECHIFTLPGIMNDIYGITYGFQGNLCTNVRILYLVDHVYPFNHEFFLRVARSFPLVTHLTVLNNRFRNNVDESNDHISSVVEFRYLISLTIHYQRVVYLEQFLVYTNTHLPNLIDLTISYNNLVTVTDNFQREITRRNCSKVKTLAFTIHTTTGHSKDFYSYFPSLKKLL